MFYYEIEAKCQTTVRLGLNETLSSNEQNRARRPHQSEETITGNQKEKRQQS